MMYDKLLKPATLMVARAEELLDGDHGLLDGTTDQRQDVEAILECAQQHIDEFNQIWTYIDRQDVHTLVQLADQTLSPLNAITGYCWFLLEGFDGDLSPSQHQAVQDIRRAAEFLLSQFHNLWDYARIQAGAEIWINPIFFDLQSRIVEPLELPPTIHYELERGLPWIYADEIFTRQCVHQLLDNAQRFAPDGQITLKAAASRGKVRITVQDTGPGIAPAHLDHLYEPFWQADSMSGGLGLGLFIVQSHARMMGGSIQVESTPGEGTRFTLTLPTHPV